MVKKSKKMAAALAAVSLYLQQEQAAQEVQEISEHRAPGIQTSMWGHSGRQEIMAMRRLIQLRTFTRF
ncbi:MAG: hypothetical protein ACI8ZB_001622 [Desulforhopalus sp.]|jgi:hypothetical protein